MPFFYGDGKEIPGDWIKSAVVRSDLTPIPETLEMDLRLDSDNAAQLVEGKDLFVSSPSSRRHEPGIPFRILMTEVSRRNAEQGSRQLEQVRVTAVLRPLYPLTFVRERAIWLENTTLSDIYRTCGAQLMAPVNGDISVPVFNCMIGDTPTFGIAKLFQEHGGVLRVNRERQMEFVRLPDLFAQKPTVSVPANTTEEVASGFIERHEIPWFVSVKEDGSFVSGNSGKARKARYIHGTSEDRLRNLSRVLVQSKRARLDLNMSICAGDAAQLSDGTILTVLTAAHSLSTGTDGSNIAQYTKVWLGALNERQ